MADHIQLSADLVIGKLWYDVIQAIVLAWLPTVDGSILNMVINASAVTLITIASFRLMSSTLAGYHRHQLRKHDKKK